MAKGVRPVKPRTAPWPVPCKRMTVAAVAMSPLPYAGADAVVSPLAALQEPDLYMAGLHVPLSSGARLGSSISDTLACWEDVKPTLSGLGHGASTPSSVWRATRRIDAICCRLTSVWRCDSASSLLQSFEREPS